MKRSMLLVALCAVCLVAPTASAMSALPGGVSWAPPRLLPGDATSSRASDVDTWLVGAAEAPTTAALARRFGATRVLPGIGAYRVARTRARRFVRALRSTGAYRFSEPNVSARRTGYPAEPGLASEWSLAGIGADGLTPPPVFAESPLLAIIDEGFDSTHPEWSGAQLSSLGGLRFGLHQNAVASVAGAPANGLGIAGVWPGMRLLLVDDGTYCDQAARAVLAAARAGARVINMSYGFEDGCFLHQVATSTAYGQGAVLVAAAGNDGIIGYRGTSPAEDPHVITVAALAPGDASPSWSNANDAIDLAAPGTAVLTAIPSSRDSDDGVRDGYATLDGTSFASPIVAAATAWTWQERPRLDQTQITELIRTATRDLGPAGWDRMFGFGAFHLPTALSARAPRRDYLEPNDDIGWIDGSVFNRADPPVWRGRGAVAFAGTVDQLEDPVDVFAFQLRPRSTARIRVASSYGDSDVAVYGPRARTVFGHRGQIGGSYRSGRRPDVVWLENRSWTRAFGYVAVFPKTSGDLSSGYLLGLRAFRL